MLTWTWSGPRMQAGSVFEIALNLIENMDSVASNWAGSAAGDYQQSKSEP